MERDNAIDNGLNAAKQKAQEDGLGGKVEDLSQQLQQGLKTGKDDEDGDVLTHEINRNKGDLPVPNPREVSFVLSHRRTFKSLRT